MAESPQSTRTTTACQMNGKPGSASIRDDADDNSSDNDRDGYTNVEEYLNGTDPTKFVDYTIPANNINPLQ